MSLILPPWLQRELLLADPPHLLAFKGGAGTDLRRTTNVPDDILFSACGFAILTSDANTWGNIISLEDGTASASAGIYLQTGSDGTTLNILGVSGQADTAVATLTLGRPFFWAVTSSGTTTLFGHYMPIGARTLTSIQATGTRGGTTPVVLFIGNDSYGEPWPGRIWGVRVWDAVLSTAELLREARQILPVRLNELNGVWPAVRSRHIQQPLLDLSDAQRTLTATGTITFHPVPNVVPWIDRANYQREVFYAGAGGAAPVTITTSLTAAVQQARTAAGSLNTAVQQGRSATASVSAAVQQARAQTASVNATIQQARTVAANLTAAVEALRSAAASTSVAVQQPQALQASLNAALQQALSVSAALTAAVLAARAATSSLSVYVLAEGAGSVQSALDAAVQQARAAAASVSAAVQQARSATSSLDTVAQAARSIVAALDLNITAGFQVTALLDTAVLAARTTAASLSLYVSTTDAPVAFSGGYGGGGTRPVNEDEQRLRKQLEDELEAAAEALFQAPARAPAAVRAKVQAARSDLSVLVDDLATLRALAKATNRPRLATLAQRWSSPPAARTRLDGLPAALLLLLGD